MHDDGDKGYGGNEERYNDSAVFRRSKCHIPSWTRFYVHKDGHYNCGLVLLQCTRSVLSTECAEAVQRIMQDVENSRNEFHIT